MAAKISTINIPQSLCLNGVRDTGKSVRQQNADAVSSLANIVKSSFGPIGMDKMMVDEVGDISISNDGATILNLLEVEHPASKILVELAKLQDQEVGDGTTTVVILAAELLKSANLLVEQHISPTTVISGYRMACKEACKFIKSNLIIDTSDIDRECIVNAAKTSLNSKLIGSNGDFFANMAVDAAMLVKMPRSDGKGFSYSVNCINVIKAHGQSVRESELIYGCALNLMVPSQQMVKRVENPKIALLSFNLQKVRLKLGIQILVSDPENLEAMRKRESDITKAKIQKLIDAGANVVITSGGIDDLCLKYFVEAGVMALRRCKKPDMRRLSTVLGATVIKSLADMDEEESYDPSCLGHAEEIYQRRICDDEMIIIKNAKERRGASIILRGANDHYVDEMERSIHDALCVAQKILEGDQVVPGGGACEAALSIHLEKFASQLDSREQMAIQEFANALLIIPRQLAVNAAQDAAELVGQLRAAHSKNQTDLDLKWTGMDLFHGIVRNNKDAGVLEPVVSKIKSIRFATEAAITILRIDDVIKLEKEQKQAGGVCC